MHELTRRHNTDFSTLKKTSRHSDESYESQESESTAPSSVDSRPALSHAFTAGPKLEMQEQYVLPTAQITELHPRDSSESQASTVSTEEEQELFDEPLEYDLPEHHHEFSSTIVKPSTPHTFSEYFPSTKRLFIRHDETTIDGNMNLRVDIEGTSSTSPYVRETIQLFHMRMHDLKSREFSLRRYSRDSGREVCHTSRRYTKPASLQRPSLQRSVSHALASFRGAGKPDFKRTNSGMSAKSGKSTSTSTNTKALPQRQDSGYESSPDSECDDSDDEVESFMSPAEKTLEKAATSLPLPTNTTKLEFSNYAQIDVRRRGARGSKRYDFEYWGNTYSWKRTTERHSPKPSYHLVRGDGPAIAHIVPELLTQRQMNIEEEQGGWVPPCIMWISDKNILEGLTDVAEVIVSTGLIALLDDCIKARWHTPKRLNLNIPLTPRIDMEFVSPRAIIEQVFKRRNSGASVKTTRSPLRWGEGVEAY